MLNRETTLLLFYVVQGSIQRWCQTCGQSLIFSHKFSSYIFPINFIGFSPLKQIEFMGINNTRISMVLLPILGIEKVQLEMGKNFIDKTGPSIQGVPAQYDFWDLKKIVLCEIRTSSTQTEFHQYEFTNNKLLQ